MCNASLTKGRPSIRTGRSTRWCIALGTAMAGVAFMLGVLSSPAQAQPKWCEKPTLAPYCGSADKLGDLLPWDLWFATLRRDPYNDVLCWGLDGHSGVADYDQPGVDRYRRFLYLQAGDGWEIHGNIWWGGWSWGLNKFGLQMWDPDGWPILGESVGSKEYRWGIAPKTGEYTILYTPDPFLGMWGHQGAWSFYWKTYFRGAAYSCRQGGGDCRPGKDCPQ